MIPFTPAPKLPSPASHRVTVVSDDRAIHSLVDAMIQRSGLSQSEIARRLGIRLQSLAQYRRVRKPSLKWLARLAEVTGARIVVEFGSHD